MANTKPKTPEEELQEILDDHGLQKRTLKVAGEVMLIQIIPCVVIVPLIWLLSDFLFPMLLCIIIFVPWLGAALNDGAKE